MRGERGADDAGVGTEWESVRIERAGYREVPFGAELQPDVVSTERARNRNAAILNGSRLDDVLWYVPSISPAPSTAIFKSPVAGDVPGARGVMVTLK